MIISHSKKFIFIHVFKVAGNTIRRALNSYNFDKSFKNKWSSYIGFYPKVFSSDFPSHISAKEIKGKILPSIYNEYFKFAFVRNPWDWQVSQYHFMKQNKSHFQYEIIKNFNFEDFIEWRINNDLRFQRDLLFDDQGKQLVNFIGRFENLQKDFNQICDIIKIPRKILSIKNQSKHEHYSCYYDESLKKKLEKAFEKDIETFKYRFEN